jgi:hypothetical protein
VKVISDPKKKDVTRAYPAYTETGYRIPGAKAIRIDPITGQQIPIMLPTAEVYSDTSPLSGLQDIVSGSTYGQLAKSYQMDPAKLSEARTVNDLFAEMTGVAGTGRAINRMTGGDTLGNRVFRVSEDDPTVDKAFDYMDLAATVPLVGLAAAGTKAGIKAIRNLPKNINADKIPYLLDKVMKENKAKGFYGGPFANPYDLLSTNNINDMVRNIRRGMNPDAAADLHNMSEVDAISKDLDAMRKKVTKSDGSLDYSLLGDEDKKRLSKYMMDSLRGRMPISSSSSSASEKMQSILRAIANDDVLKRYALGAANRAVSASRYVPPIRRVLQKGVEDAIRYGGAAATYASTGMNRSMRQALANLVERNPSISRLTGNKLDEMASQFGGDRGADYSGIRVSGAESSDLRAVRDKGEAPDLISAYMYGDFSNFYPTNVPNPDKLAKMLFGKYYDRYGDMEIRKMETKISSTKDKPLIIKEGRYGGLQVPRDNASELLTENTINNPKNSTYGKIVLEELKIKSNSLASFSPERRVEQLAKDLGEDASTSVSRIFENIRKSDEKTYNVILDDDNIPVQFQYLANENTNNPLSPIYDVGGHQMIWELDRVDGDNLIYKVTSADLWKFSSDDYVYKWGLGNEKNITSKNVPIHKQSSIMDALGKPFITMSEDYIQIPKFIAERAGKEYKNIKTIPTL